MDCLLHQHDQVHDEQFLVIREFLRIHIPTIYLGDVESDPFNCFKYIPRIMHDEDLFDQLQLCKRFCSFNVRDYSVGFNISDNVVHPCTNGDYNLKEN